MVRSLKPVSVSSGSQSSCRLPFTRQQHANVQRVLRTCVDPLCRSCYREKLLSSDNAIQNCHGIFSE